MKNANLMLPIKKTNSTENEAKPIVCIAILAKDKEESLPLYLQCIEKLDYPKKRITLYIRTNDNSDSTENILKDWVSRVSGAYHSVSFNSDSVDSNLVNYRNHHWDKRRFRALGAIRLESLNYAVKVKADFFLLRTVIIF